MKTTRITASLLAATVGISAALFVSGCAGTTTRESTGEYIDNSAITAKVKAALVQDPNVRARDVKVETFRGTVQLSGFVDTDAQKNQATEVARSIAGVAAVQNNLIVKAP